jgi:hypothetical protein
LNFLDLRRPDAPCPPLRASRRLTLSGGGLSAKRVCPTTVPRLGRWLLLPLDRLDQGSARPYCYGLGKAQTSLLLAAPPRVGRGLKQKLIKEDHYCMRHKDNV